MKLPISIKSDPRVNSPPPSWSTPWMVSVVGADSRDLPAHAIDQMAKLLHMRFRSRVAETVVPLANSCRHHGIFGAGNTGLIQQDVRATELPCAKAKGFIKRQVRLPSIETTSYGCPPGDDRSYPPQAGEDQQRQTGPASAQPTKSIL